MANRRTVQIGTITAPHGLGGAVRVQLTTDFPERLASLSEVWLDAVRDAPWECAEWTVLGPTAILKLKAVANRDQALRLKGCRIVIPVERLPRLEPNAFYWHELIGLNVQDAEGRMVGQVAHVRRHGGAHDFLEVKKADGSTFWLPMVRPLVTGVDLDAGIIHADLPPGLEDLPAW
jgi:16S rRNA processing protein RimM